MRPPKSKAASQQPVSAKHKTVVPEPENFVSGFVSIVGKPNAGKSTLLNALIGEKVAITAHQAQTTRTSIQGILTTPRSQIIFIDTPGIHKSDNLINRRMMDTVRGALAGRDLVLFCADASRSVNEEDEHAVSALNRDTPSLLILTKVDRVEDKRHILPLIERYMALYSFADAVPVSARKADGIERLIFNIESRLPKGSKIHSDDLFTNQPMRFIACEIIREQILRKTRNEVPHSTAVVVDQWEDKPNLIRINATIHVERDGQKIIVIGHGGAMLKQIGTAARIELERITGSKVFLGLHVKVKPNWREDAEFLNSLDWRSMVGSEEG